MSTAFDNLTDEACSTCLELYNSKKIRREHIMPLPECAPVSYITNNKICKDCQSAENLTKFFGLDFEMNRLAVGNERSESLRLPEGMSSNFGFTRDGLCLPADMSHFKGHMDWLDTVAPYDDTED